MSAIRLRLSNSPWMWSFGAAAATWLVAIVASRGQGAGDMLTTALSFSVFSAMVGTGQMFVIAAGPGNVDLSIPSAIVLGGVVAMKVMAAAGTFPGLLAACLVGGAIGLCSAGLIRLLRVPPIIATLAMSFLVQSVAVAYGRGLLVQPPPMLATFTTARVLGLPVLPVFGMALSALLGLLLHRTLYGQAVLAIGQNERAAWLARWSGPACSRIC